MFKPSEGRKYPFIAVESTIAGSDLFFLSTESGSKLFFCLSLVLLMSLFMLQVFSKSKRLFYDRPFNKWMGEYTSSYDTYLVYICIFFATLFFLLGVINNLRFAILAVLFIFIPFILWRLCNVDVWISKQVAKKLSKPKKFPITTLERLCPTCGKNLFTERVVISSMEGEEKVICGDHPNCSYAEQPLKVPLSIGY